MALAWIKYRHSIADKHYFRIDIGSQRFFRYAIGDHDTYKVYGIRRMKNTLYRSPVLLPREGVRDEIRSEFMISIPDALFNRANRYIQLESYSTRAEQGPAWSELIYVPPVAVSNEILQKPISNIFSRPEYMDEQIKIQNKPFDIKEIQLSQGASFWEFLGKAIPTILPIVGNAIKDTKLSEIFKDEELLNEAVKFIESLKAQEGNDASTQDTAVSAQQTLALSTTSSKLMASEAMAIDPITITAVAGAAKAIAPEVNKWLTTITNGIIDFFGGRMDDLSVYDDKTDNLTALLMQQNAAAKQLKQLEELRSESASVRAFNKDMMDLGIDFVRVPSVKLSIDGIKSLNVKNKLGGPIYDLNSSISIPLSLKTPKPISKAWLKVIIKSGKEVILVKKWKLENQGSGSIQVQPQLEQEDLVDIIAGQEYYLCFRLLWPGRSGQRLGSSISTNAVFTEAYTYQSIGGFVDEPKPLNDIQAHRAYWHKIWTTAFSSVRKEFKLDNKYYYTINPNGTHLKLESVMKESETDGSHTVDVLMKTGFKASLYGINQLRKMWSKQPLDDAIIEALKDMDFIHDSGLLARRKVKFFGFDGESAALWVYPVMQLRAVQIRKTLRQDSNGLVTAMSDIEVELPMPTTLHFIGTKLED